MACPALTKLDAAFSIGETLSCFKWTEMSNQVNNDSPVRYFLDNF
jgi:hypothetical protein